MRLRKNTFHYIEKEIYDYQKTKKHLEELTSDIINSTTIPHEIRSTDVSDPTFHVVSLLTLCKIKTRMEEVIEVVDSILMNMEPTAREALQDKYWERPKKSWQEIAFEHSVSKSALYKWRSGFIGAIAERLGMR